jgi:hypothetical protein
MSQLSRRELMTTASLGMSSVLLPAASAASTGGGASTPVVPVVVADAPVQAAGPTTNYGTAELLLKNYLTAQRLSYLRFDLTGTAWTATSTPTLAVTTLNNNNGTAGVTTTFEVAVYGLLESDPGYAWGETTITWNTRPAAGPSIDGRYIPSAAGATLLGTIAVASAAPPTRCALTGTGLRDFLRSLTGPAATFILIRVDTTNANLSFHSRETGAAGGHQPGLSLG